RIREDAARPEIVLAVSAHARCAAAEEALVGNQILVPERSRKADASRGGEQQLVAEWEEAEVLQEAFEKTEIRSEPGTRDFQAPRGEPAARRIEGIAAAIDDAAGGQPRYFDGQVEIRTGDRRPVAAVAVAVAQIDRSAE